MKLEKFKILICCLNVYLYTFQSFAVDLSSILKTELHKNGCPGAVLSVRDPSGKWQRYTLGQQEINGEKLAMREDLNFPLASVSKLFVSYLLMKQVDAGLLDLNQPLNSYLPKLNTSSWNPTLRDIAQHRSGLFNPIESQKFQQQIVNNPQRIWKDLELINFSLKQPFYFKPNQGFHYSNANTSLLVHIMEQVSEKTYNDLLKEYLINPFKLTSTQLLDTPGVPQPHAQGYRHAPKNWPIGYGKTLMKLTDWSPTWGGSGGNLVSTLYDLEKVAPALIEGKGLSPKSQTHRLNFQATKNNDWHYGLHISRHKKWIGHKGDVPGWSSAILATPDASIIVIALCNLSNTSNGKQPAALLAEKTLQILSSTSP